MMRDTQQPVITKPKPKPKVLSFSEALKDLRDKPIRDADGAWMQWLLDLTVRATPASPARLHSGGVRGGMGSWCMLDVWASMLHVGRVGRVWRVRPVGSCLCAMLGQARRRGHRGRGA